MDEDCCSIGFFEECLENVELDYWLDDCIQDLQYVMLILGIDNDITG